MGVPSRWSAGTQWGSAASDPLEAYWGPNAVPVQRPVCYVSIAGVLQPTVMAATWRLGRNGWFDDLVPSTASFTFYDAATGSIGDTVLVTSEAGLHWSGTVESISTSKQLGTGLYASSVTAVDNLARHGQAKMTTALSYGGSTLEGLLTNTPGGANSLLFDLGLEELVVTVGDSATSLPTLSAALSTEGRTLLEYLQLAEKSSNALMAYQPDGSFLIVTRDALVAASVDVLDLVGENAPRAWTVDTTKASVINHWSFDDTGGTNRLEETDTASVALYGENAYTISDYMDTSVTHFPALMRAAVATPRPIVTNGQFPITSTDQAVLLLDPFDWVSFDGDTWQVMSVEHNVTPNDWSLTITADVSQNYMGGVSEPTPVEPDDTYTVTTDTYTSTKSTTVVKSSSGTFMGNGAGDYLPVGYYSGFRHRACIDFTTLAKPTGYVSVKKATLNLRTTGQQWVAFGSSPKFYARRITESWSEGTYDAAPTSQYSTTNATVWPGPSTVTAGQTLKSCADTENNDISVDVTDIIQRAFDIDAFYGIKLTAANEDANVNCIEFYSDDHGTSGYRPELVVQCYTT